MKTILLLTLLIPLFALSQTKPKTKPVTVDSVDLERYGGLWYEVAKVPNRFQKQCVKNTTAEYMLKENGEIRVVNRCVDNEGETILVKGRARVVDTTSNAKLKVSFVRFLGLNLFWGDYWIIGLDKEYNWAVVGTPSRKYGWVLSRTPELSEEAWSRINSVVSEQGYNPGRFRRTVQEY